MQKGFIKPQGFAVLCVVAIMGGYFIAGSAIVAEQNTAEEVTPSQTHREIVSFQENDFMQMLLEYCYHHPSERIQGFNCFDLDLSDWIHPIHPRVDGRKTP